MELHYGITDSKPWGLSKRQASRSMSFSHANYYSGELEHAAAVAAAAYAITSLEMTRSLSHPAMARPYYRDEESRRNNRGKVNRSGSTLTEKIIRQVPSMKRTPTFSSSNRYPKEIQTPTFSGSNRYPKEIQTPTFSGGNRYPEEIQTQNPETDTQMPSFGPPQSIQLGGANKSSRVQESEADNWERAQLDIIKQRYEKLYMTISEWEDKKRKKAEKKLRSTDGELGKRRSKALQSYQDDIERIRQVAEGARSQAREKRRKEEMKVHDKANKLRTTGQLPNKCTATSTKKKYMYSNKIQP